MNTKPDPLEAADDAQLGNLALEFLYTVRAARGGRVDLFQTPQDFLAWLRRHTPSASATDVQVSEARVVLDEARSLRVDIGLLVEARHRRRILPEWALFGVNRILEGSRWSWTIAQTVDGLALEEHPAGRGPAGLLAPVALAAVRLLVTVPADRLRPCASSRCGAWFVDTSKGGRRRWCSMARCGNREKAAVHRAKVPRH
ncbi:MAG: CGNR zinc finger domain-containing protein [Longimicrobiales bacterium]